jgi:hypothetical protein
MLKVGDVRVRRLRSVAVLAAARADGRRPVACGMIHRHRETPRSRGCPTSSNCSTTSIQRCGIWVLEPQTA